MPSARPPLWMPNEQATQQFQLEVLTWSALGPSPQRAARGPPLRGRPPHLLETCPACRAGFMHLLLYTDSPATPAESPCRGGSRRLPTPLCVPACPAPHAGALYLRTVKRLLAAFMLRSRCSTAVPHVCALTAAEFVTHAAEHLCQFTHQRCLRVAHNACCVGCMAAGGVPS